MPIRGMIAGSVLAGVLAVMMLAASQTCPAGSPSDSTSLAPASGPATAPAISEAAIRQAIRDLADDEQEIRDKASDTLWSAGEAAVDALTEASRSGDAEVADRAKAILEKFRHGIFGDTPADVVALIDAYRQADSDEKSDAIEKIAAHPTWGIKVLARLLKGDSAAIDVDSVEDALADRLLHDVRLAEEANDAPRVETAMKRAAEHLPARMAGMYVTHVYAEGKLPAAIAAARDARQHVVLAHLQRASGDLAAAAAAAREGGDHELAANMLLLKRDWPALAVELQALLNGNFEGQKRVNYLGLLAACHRRTGNGDAFRQCVSDILELGRKHDRVVCWPALLANECFDEAIELTAGGKEFFVESDVLLFRQQFEQAIEVIRKRAEGDANEDYEAAVQEQTPARLLFDRGLKEEANRIFSAPFAPGITPSRYRIRAAIEALRDTGQGEQAFARAMEAMAKPVFKNNVSNLVWYACQNTPHSNTWLEILKAYDANLDAPAKLARVSEEARRLIRITDNLRKIVLGKATADEVVAWAGAIEADAAPLNADGESVETYRPPPAPVVQLAAVVRTLDRLGQREKANRFLSRLESLEGANAAAEAAEVYLQREDWKHAGPLLSRCIEKGNALPLMKFYSGLCLVRTGDDANGLRLLEEADKAGRSSPHMTPALLDAATATGLVDFAARQREHMRRLSQVGEYSFVRMLRKTGPRAQVKAGRFAAAADDVDLAILSSLWDRSSPRVFSMLDDLACAHVYRARAHIAAGEHDKAMAEVKQYLRFGIGHINGIEEVVNDWDHAGRRDLADQLFEQLWTFNAALCGRYGQYIHGLNNTAWLAARCHRKLPEAQVMAEKAVELAPGKAFVLDTLAEVLLQRGNHAAAVEASRKALECIDDTHESRPRYIAALKRIEANDAKSSPPED